MEEEGMNNSDKWLDEVDEMVFNFKRKVHSWLKETNEDDRFSKSSSKTKSHSSVNLQEEVQNRAVQVAPNLTG